MTNSAAPSERKIHGTDNTPDQIAAARALIVSRQFGSVNMLQRNLNFGLLKALSVMDELERQGVVGPGKGSSVREVLIRPGEES